MSGKDMEHHDIDAEQAQDDIKDQKTKAKKKSPIELRRYTKQIWLAGLGAFSRAEEEGNKLFDSLVQVGEELEAKTQDLADNTAEKVGEVTGKALERVTDTKGKVEKLIDQHTHQTLNRIGLVTPKDILMLEQMLVSLTQKVDRLMETNYQLLEEIDGLKKNKK